MNCLCGWKPAHLKRFENFSIILNKLNYSKGSGLQLIYMRIGPIQFLFIFILSSPSFHLFFFMGRIHNFKVEGKRCITLATTYRPI